MKPIITASLAEQNYRVDIRSQKHQIFADEPQELGGGDTAMTPYELLSASLAACTLATLRMYAERKQWNVGKIYTDISLEVLDENRTKKVRFLREIRFSQELTQEMKDRLKQIAEACPVSKILKSSLNSIETLVK